MVEQDAELGEVVGVFGRDESPRRRWGQAGLLGVLTAMFIAPAFGFPILAGGPRYLTFFLVTVGAAVVLTVIFRSVRRNRAARLYERGISLVDGPNERTVPFVRLRRAGYVNEQLEVETLDDVHRVRLGPREAASFLSALEGQLSLTQTPSPHSR